MKILQRFVLFIIILFFSFGNSFADVSSGLVAYYPFDGNANDASGNGNHGTVYGATPSEDRNGNINRAYSFDGIDDYIDIDNTAAFDNMQSFTLTGWFYLKSYGGYSRVILSKVTPNRDFVVEIWPNGKLNAHFASSRYYHCASHDPMPLNQWLHFGAVWNGNEWTLYLNGSIIDFRNYSGSKPPWTGNYMSIGSLISGSTEFFHGNIDEIRIYNRALSTTEIREVMSLDEKKAVIVNNQVLPVVQDIRMVFGVPIKFEYDMALQNISNTAISNPLYMEVADLNTIPATEPLAVTITNADNGEDGVGAMFDFSNSLEDDGVLSPAEISTSKTLTFNLAEFINFDFSVNVFGIVQSALTKSIVVNNERPIGMAIDVKNPNVQIIKDSDRAIINPLPLTFVMEQNYPNPFNPETTIRYQLPQPSKVHLSIFNLIGQEIRTLVDAVKTAGYHSVAWDGRDNANVNVGSGTFIYRMQAGQLMEVKKLILIR